MPVLPPIQILHTMSHALAAISRVFERHAADLKDDDLKLLWQQARQLSYRITRTASQTPGA